MRLTDEEKRIADEVAWHFLDSVDDAWARALEYIAARRKALGEVESTGTATAAGVGGEANDGEEIGLSDYVVAFAWNGYQQRERCVVGYVSEYVTEKRDGRDVRHYTVTDDNGDALRVDRLGKITPEEHRRLSSDRKEGESPWEHLARIRGEAKGVAAGVGAPTADSARWSSLVDKVEQVADDICGVGSGVTVDGKPEDWLDAIAREHHRLRIEAARRDKPGTATAAGVAAPTAEAVSNEVTHACMPDDLPLNLGDYVLAETVLPDGRKHFFAGRISAYDTEVLDGVEPVYVRRYEAKDCHGIAFPVRRAEKITSQERSRMLSIAMLDPRLGETPWDCLARIRGEAKGGAT